MFSGHRSGSTEVPVPVFHNQIMQKPSVDQHAYQQDVADAEALMDAGGGVYQLPPGVARSGVVRGLVATAARQRGFMTHIKPDGLHITPDPDYVPPLARGGQKSDDRLALEAVPPGGFEIFVCDAADAMRIRAIIQSMRRHGYVFSTQYSEAGGLVATRIDSLSQASPEMRADLLASQRSRWPLADMEVGEQRTSADINDIGALRAAANYQKVKYGKVFSVKKSGAEIVITRTL